MFRHCAAIHDASLHASRLVKYLCMVSHGFLIINYLFDIIEIVLRRMVRHSVIHGASKSIDENRSQSSGEAVRW